MRHKINNITSVEFAPALNQDIVNLIASYVSYAEGLAALRQTSRTMNRLIETTHAGQLNNLLNRDAADHGRRYEVFFAIPVSFLSIPAVTIPVCIGILAGLTGCMASPFIPRDISSTFRSSTKLIQNSCRLFGKASDKSKQILLADTLNERRQIEQQQEMLRVQLTEPVSSKMR